MPNQKALMLVDEQTAYNLSRLPKTREDLKENADIITFNELKNCVLKEINKEPEPFSSLSCEMSHILMPSPVYTNRYYHAEDFIRLYEEDFKMAMQDLANKMGGFVEITLHKGLKHNKEQESKSSDLDGEASVAQGASLKYNRNAQSAKSHKKANKSSTSHMRLKTNKPVSSSELKQKIEQEHINLACFPSEFRLAIDEFLKHGKITGGFGSTKHEYSATMAEGTKDSLDFSINITQNIKDKIASKFPIKIDISKQERFNYTKEEIQAFESFEYRAYFPELPSNQSKGFFGALFAWLGRLFKRSSKEIQ